MTDKLRLFSPLSNKTTHISKHLCVSHKGITLTWTHREIMSAKCDSDLMGYFPLREGSTILVKRSISCSWGIAHLTKNCSPRLRVLNMICRCVNWEKRHNYISSKGCRRLFTGHMTFCLLLVPASPRQNCKHHFGKCKSPTQIQEHRSHMLLEVVPTTEKNQWNVTSI